MHICTKDLAVVLQWMSFLNQPWLKRAVSTFQKHRTDHWANTAPKVQHHVWQKPHAVYQCKCVMFIVNHKGEWFCSHGTRTICSHWVNHELQGQFAIIESTMNSSLNQTIGPNWITKWQNNNLMFSSTSIDWTRKESNYFNSPVEVQIPDWLKCSGRIFRTVLKLMSENITENELRPFWKEKCTKFPHCNARDSNSRKFYKLLKRGVYLVFPYIFLFHFHFVLV